MDTDIQQYGDFPGRDRLIAALDAAVRSAGADAGRCVAAIGRDVEALRRGAALTLPPAVRQTHPDHYARRELYRSAEYGYCVVAMTWAPGQDTPLHDHDGLWGVVCVWEGQLTITDYALTRTDPTRAWFRPLPPVVGTPGAVGVVVPPAEHHVIANRSPTALAISLHVYQCAAEACTIFLPQADGSFARQRMQLAAER